MSSLALQLRDYRLTTANVVYHMPDHPSVLQEFIWQQLDMAPDFPALKRFLEYWERNIEARLHSVTVANARIITPGEFRQVEHLAFMQ